MFHGISAATTNSKTHTWYIAELILYSQNTVSWEYNPIANQAWFCIFVAWKNKTFLYIEIIIQMIMIVIDFHSTSKLIK